MIKARRLLGPVAIHGEGNHVVSVDLGTFVTRVLLSETYVLQSVQQKDIVLLTHPFGQSGLSTLFQTGALKLYYDTFTIGQMGQARADLNFQGKNKRLPLCSYSFSEVRVPDQEQQLEATCSLLGQELRDAIKMNRITTPSTFKAEVFAGLYHDIRYSPAVLEAAVRHNLKTRGISASKLTLSVEEVEPEDFRVENDLESQYGISKEMAHRVIERAILASADINVRFAQMKACEAVSGIAEKDLPVLHAKLGAVAGLIEMSDGAKQFERVAKVAGLQGPVFGQTKVDAEKLLRVRESDDCRAFRDWLADTGALSAKEVKDRIRGLNARICQAMNSTPGKTIRLVISAGLGLLPHTTGLIGLGASVIDQFILERLAPRDAVVAFLSDLYPSLFRKD